MRSEPRWVFDALPPSGARRGGNPAEHAFRHDLVTFVREVVQNANDQAALRPRVVFRHVALQGEERSAFLRALDWSVLEQHLRSATALPDTDRMRAALDAIDAGESLPLLFIEDHGTEGLTGREDADDGHFRALCKDTLFSNKSEDAGGSYGLGKSVLWIFSSLSTVLFDSTLLDAHGNQNPRVIGRAELPSHELPSHEMSPESYQGPGWFGARRATDRGERAESLWGPEARRLARSLGFRDREDHDTGTSICVVGFRDPTADMMDDDRGAEHLASRTREAIAEFFWPAMALPSRPLSAAVLTGEGGQEVDAGDAPVGPFADAWGRYLSGGLQSRLEEPGDVCAATLPLRIPATRAGTPAIDAEVSLVVRLSSNTKTPRTGQVALFRGPGMVVRYDDRSRVALGMRPFHAILACGRARAPKAPTDADRAVETFLRMAEPPTHDRWESTQRLKAHYARGYKKAIDDLRAAVDQALQRLLIAPHAIGERGPERLQRRFPIGHNGAGIKRASPFAISALQARPEEGRWAFSGVIERTSGRGPWKAHVRLSEVDERGKRVDGIAITALRVDEGSITVVIEDGVAEVSAAADVQRVPFGGVSEASRFLGALELELGGHMGDS